MFLTADDKKSIEARVAALEQSLGLDVVTLVAGKSDTYPEIVWKAFALGASLSAFGVAVEEALHPDWMSGGTILVVAATILGVGALCALAAVYVPAFARLFLRETRAALETMQYARTQFLERELFATRERTAILVFVSLLERRVVVLPDTGVRRAGTPAEWDAVVAAMTAKLADGALRPAILAGLDAIEALVAGKGVARDGGSAFANAPVEEAGP